MTVERRAVELIFLMAWVLLGTVSPALAQLPQAEEERLQILSDPEAIKKKARERQEPAAFRVFPVEGRPVRRASVCEG